MVTSQNIASNFRMLTAARVNHDRVNTVQTSQFELYKAYVRSLMLNVSLTKSQVLAVYFLTSSSGNTFIMATYVLANQELTESHLQTLPYIFQTHKRAYNGISHGFT